MASVLIDYQIKGWAQRNVEKIRAGYSDILYVGDHPSSGSSDSVLASFCAANGYDLLTSDKRAYVPWLEEQRVKEVRISLFDSGGQLVYLVRAA